MTLADGLQIYGAAITTLVILAGSIKYVISSRIAPLEGGISNIKLDLKRIENSIKIYAEELDELKQALVDEVKDISKGNFDFRLKYETSMSDLKLLLALKYTSKEDMEEIKKRVDQLNQIHYEMKTIRKSLESLQGKSK